MTVFHTCPNCGWSPPATLSPAEQRLYDYLATGPHTMREIIDHLYGPYAAGGPLWPRNAIRSFIVRINAKLPTIRIAATHRWRNVTYSIHPVKDTAPNARVAITSSL